MKFPALAACLALASAAHAGPPGSYALVTSALTLTKSTLSAPLVLANGNKQTNAVQSVTKITNAVILAECQRQGLFTGSFTGWKIYAVSDPDEVRGFYISDGLRVVSIDSVLSIARDLSGVAGKGKFVKNPRGELVSGSSTYTDAFMIAVSIDGASYLSTVAAQMTETLVPMWPLSEPIWRAGAWKITVAGVSDERNNGIVQGTLSVAAAKSSYNLSLGLFNFPASFPEE